MKHHIIKIPGSKASDYGYYVVSYVQKQRIVGYGR